ARSSGVPATALAPSIPPTHAAALEPSPRLSGIACTHSIATPVNRRPAASKSVRAARATMLASVAGSWPRPSPRTETVTPSASASVSSLYRASASPSASKPGPRLAEVAGTRTRAIIGVPGARPPGLALVEALHGRHLLAAGRAPRGPEVQEHDPPPVVGELHRLAVRGGAHEVLRGLDARGLDQVEPLEGILRDGADRGDERADARDEQRPPEFHRTFPGAETSP